MLLEVIKLNRHVWNCGTFREKSNVWRWKGSRLDSRETRAFCWQYSGRGRKARQAISEHSYSKRKCLRRSESLSARWIWFHDQNWLTHRQTIVSSMRQRRRLHEAHPRRTRMGRFQRWRWLLQPKSAVPFLQEACQCISKWRRTSWRTGHPTSQPSIVQGNVVASVFWHTRK